jgi:hypothetical protein
MSPKEPDKITVVYKEEHNRLLWYIRNRIPDRPEAEDILQDVFYQLTVGLFLLSKILLTGIAPGPRHNLKKEWKNKCEEKCRQAGENLSVKL